MEGALLVLVVRTYNAIIWTIVLRRVWRNDRPVTRSARMILCGLIVVGYWMLGLGALTQFGLDGDITRWVYTIYTAAAAIVGTALALDHEGP